MPDAGTALELDLALWQTQPGFAMGFKSEINIAGCRAATCQFRCQYIYDGTNRGHGTMPEITVKLVYFTHHDCLYGLEILTNPQSLETDGKYIERILHTFRLLE